MRTGRAWNEYFFPLSTEPRVIHDRSARLLKVLCDELDLTPADLSTDMRLSDVADSLDWMNLLTALEAEFGLRINTTEALSLETIADLIALTSEPSFVPA